ncbi:MAG: L,D-transpeptidase family protein [Sphingobium sp.]
MNRTAIPSVLAITLSLLLAGPLRAQPAAAPAASKLPQPLLAPPLIAPAAPVMIAPPPVPLPQPTAAQERWLNDWLRTGQQQGLTAQERKTTTLSGDALLSATLDHARALSTGRVAAADFLEIWALRPTPLNARPGLAQALTQDRLSQWAASLTPPYSGYDGLRRGLAIYEAIRDAGGWPALSTGASPDAIRARLRNEDKAVAPGEPIVAVLQRAQQRYGLNPTGLLDARTLKELNVPVDDRIAAIMANMERWRWMPRDLPVDRVQVNIASASLAVFKGDRPVASMRAVTGSPANATPMLSSSIHSIVVNPPWNVPASIARRELWPKGRATLIAQGYKIVGTPETGERIVQPAGPASALGRLKFDFANPFAVYLHDTPSRAKFSSYDRLASHGCVRLEKPVSLAELMVAGDPALAGRVQALIDTGKTQRVTLPSQVAVYLLYWTAFAGNDGTMSFRADPYGWDKLLARKIEASSSRATTIALKD